MRIGSMVDSSVDPENAIIGRMGQCNHHGAGLERNCWMECSHGAFGNWLDGKDPYLVLR